MGETTMKNIETLTAYGGGALEGSRHVGVHRDQHVLLLRDFRITDLDLMLDPISECVFEHGGSNVHDPLLRRLVDLDLVGQVRVDHTVALEDLFVHLLDGEALVLRHDDGAHAARLDVYKKKT